MINNDPLSNWGHCSDVKNETNCMGFVIYDFTLERRMAGFQKYSMDYGKSVRTSRIWDGTNFEESIGSRSGQGGAGPMAIAAVNQISVIVPHQSDSYSCEKTGRE